MYKDVYTITHTSKKTGKEKQYNLAQINCYVNTYGRNLQRAIDKGDAQSEAINRTSLEYWQGRQLELLEKIEVMAERL